MFTQAWSFFFWFFIRLAIGFAVVSAFVIVTQDFQVFPTLVTSVLGRGASTPGQGIERLSVKTQDGEELDVWKMPAEGERRGVVMLFHGNADTLSNLSRFQRFLAAHQITSYGFDYRGAGVSTGWPTERGLYLDSEAVAKLVLEKEGITPKQLTLFGISIGTGPSTYLTSKLGAGNLILISPYYDFPSLVKEIPLFGLLTPFLKYRLPNAEHLKGVQSTPVMIFHGARDRTIPVSHSVRIVAELGNRPNVTFVQLDGVGHNDILGAAQDKLMENLKAFGIPKDG